MLQFPRWKVLFIITLSLVGIFFALPNFVPIQQINDKKLSLGLDLQGGAHLLLQVDFDGYIAEQYEAEVDTVRKILGTERGAERIGYKDLGSEGGAVTVTIRDPQEVSVAKKLISDRAAYFDVSHLEQTITVKYDDQYLFQKRADLVSQSIEIIRKRVDETGTKEPIIQSQGEDRIVLQVPGADDPEEIKRKINTTAKLTFHLVEGEETTDPAAVPSSPENIMMPTKEGEYLEVRKRAELGGENLIDARQAYDNFGQVAVAFKFDALGGRKFGDLTKANVGRRFASVLDGVIVSAPSIREPILGGAGQITGNFDVEEANELATLLRAGALPVALKILEERSVGASLGADSIAAGKMASMIAITLVAVFMVLTYGFFGLISVFTLGLNIFLVIGALSLFQATLTLPGIAGIVLTVGMAVDANVLIFERIREELALGKSPINSIDLGFSRAFGTILDSNLTTLIVGILLFSFGSGPVKGFAVTLSIGIICSMFTAIMVGRLIISKWALKKRPKELKL